MSESNNDKEKRKGSLVLAIGCAISVGIYISAFILNIGFAEQSILGTDFRNMDQSTQVEAQSGSPNTVSAADWIDPRLSKEINHSLYFSAITPPDSSLSNVYKIFDARSALEKSYNEVFFNSCSTVVN